MADRLRVTELDFDTIKTNLKSFLKQQSEFTDYDFDGSGLSVLLDILAYNTHYNAYYLNMVANESFLDTALLRDSVVSHAKALGYTPHSKRAALAIIDFNITASSNTAAKITIPRGYSFLSNQIDGKSYNFVVLDDTTVSKSNTTFIFNDLEIYEGQLVTYNFTNIEATNPKAIFTLPDANIDTTTIKVSVSPSPSSTELTTYTLATDILEIDSTSTVFFLQEGRGGKYEIYFGNDVLGKKLPDGGIVSVSYLVTNATDANGADNFKASTSLVDTLTVTQSNFSITVTSEAAGGDDRESVDSVKFLAPTQYSAQNRLVTKKDYGTYLRSNYTNADSISVWGGEEQDPKVYGKIYLAIRPKENYFISDAEKQRIINDIIIPKTVIGTQVEILDPEYLYLKTTTTVKYDSTRTTRTENALSQAIENAIILYKNTNIDKFEATFVISKLEAAVDAVDTSILGSETEVRVEKRIEPSLGVTASYVINFNVPLHRGTILNGLRTNEFKVIDGTIERTAQIEETAQSFTGVEEIKITDPGYGYTSTPTITITGDGTGATAEATIVNGKINSITITNRGANYTKALVTISGGNGTGGAAAAIVSGKIGTLRLIYFDASAEKKIINSNIGEINYDTGRITINDLKIQSLVSGNYLKLDIESENAIIESSKNTIITIDDADPTAISIVLDSI